MGCQRVLQADRPGMEYSRTIGDKWRLSDIYRETIIHCFSSGGFYERGFDYAAEKLPIQTV
jgi:hypothetical protein